MIRKYPNHTPQFNPWHREKELQNTDCHKTSGRQLEQSNSLSISHELDGHKVLNNKTRIKHLHSTNYVSNH